MRGVADEVDQDLLQLRRLGHDECAVRRAARDEVHLRHDGTQLRHRLRQEDVQRGEVLLGQAPPAEIEDMADEFAGAFARLSDLRHVAHRDALGRNGFGGHLGMAQHGADHVVEIMRDAARERADRLEALGLSKPGLERPALVEHGFAVQRVADDIALHAQQPDGLPQPGGARPDMIETKQADHPLPAHQLGAGPGPDAGPIERGPQGGWKLLLLVGRAKRPPGTSASSRDGSNSASGHPAGVSTPAFDQRWTSCPSKRST